MKLIANLELRRRQAVLGLFTAWQLTVALVAFVPIFIATPAVAQKPATCFMRVECLNLDTKGNCDKEHCFEVRKECPDSQGLCYSNPPAIPLIISFGNKTQVLDISDYIAVVFNFGAAAAGTVATVMFMVGGFQYLTAGGDSGRVSAGKKRITDALLGMMLVLGSVLMLRTVNPDILRLQMPKIEIVKKKLFVGCDQFSLKVKCGDPFTIIQLPNAKESDPIEKQFKLGSADDLKQKKGIVCRGVSCGMAGLDDGTYKCKKDPNSSEKPTEVATQCGGKPAAPYICAACAGWAGNCAQQGKSDDCCTGFCGTRSNALATKDVAVTVGVNPVAGTAATIGKGLCTNGEAGVNCDGNGECKSGRCQTRGFHTCSSGLTGAACDNAGQCAGGYACPQITGMFICTPRVPGSYCLNDGDCADGYTCPKKGESTLADVAAAGAAGGAAVSDKCDSVAKKTIQDCDQATAGWEVANTECNSQMKVHWAIAKTPAGLLLPGCSDLAIMAGKKLLYCASVVDLKIKCGLAGVVIGAGTTVVKKADEQFTKYEVMERCRPATNLGNCKLGQQGQCPQGMECRKTDNDQFVCTTGEDGSPCLTKSDCASGGFCIAAITSLKGMLSSTGKPGICTMGLVGERCSRHEECKDHHCYVGDSISATRGALTVLGSAGEEPYGFCTSGQLGAGCNPDKDGGCETGLTCSKEAHRCINKNACSGT